MAIRNSGKIIGINVDRGETKITLDNDPKVGPKDNVWFLRQEHRNYNALFSLALAAAGNRWTVTVRIEGGSEININEEAGVKNMAVEFKN